jgi:hypothetical protein
MGNQTTAHRFGGHFQQAIYRTIETAVRREQEDKPIEQNLVHFIVRRSPRLYGKKRKQERDVDRVDQEFLRPFGKLRLLFSSGAFT